MRFYRHGRAARKAHAFNNIRVKRALGKKGRAFDPVRIFLEHVDKQTPDNLALGFRITDAIQFAQK